MSTGLWAVPAGAPEGSSSEALLLALKQVAVKLQHKQPPRTV
jgi:hypothetical protein